MAGIYMNLILKTISLNDHAKPPIRPWDAPGVVRDQGIHVLVQSCYFSLSISAGKLRGHNIKGKIFNFFYIFGSIYRLQFLNLVLKSIYLIYGLVSGFSGSLVALDTEHHYHSIFNIIFINQIWINFFDTWSMWTNLLNCHIWDVINGGPWHHRWVD